ncbi:hypothetical protein J6590_095882 [Homalodisca vitripennis]|nr:hypothetical protein J6590_095882 [Homalodisca vitripennis]
MLVRDPAVNDYGCSTSRAELQKLVPLPSEAVAVPGYNPKRPNHGRLRCRSRPGRLAYSPGIVASAPPQLAGRENLDQQGVYIWDLGIWDSGASLVGPSE